MKDCDVDKENITQVDSRQAFEWIKTGKWSLAKFQLWYFGTLHLHAVEFHNTLLALHPEVSNKAGQIRMKLQNVDHKARALISGVAEQGFYPFNRNGAENAGSTPVARE